MKNADRRIALVTGGNRGLGLQTARQLISQDIHVILGCRDYKKGETVAQELRVEGHQVEALELDVTNQSTHQAAYDYLEKEYGRLDILINNAAVWKESTTSSSPFRKAIEPAPYLRKFCGRHLRQTFLGPWP